MMMRHSRRLLVILGALFVVLLAAAPAEAHPMGNFSVNHYSAITVSGHQVQVLYLVDMAEIPTFQELSALGVDRSTALVGMQRRVYLAKKAGELVRGLHLTENGTMVRLTPRATDLIFPPGAGGLPTERVYMTLDGTLPAGAGTLRYTDSTFAGHTGWEEIVANGAGVLHASVPSASRTDALTVYPTAVTSSPPQDLQAAIDVRPAATMGLPSPGAVIRRAEAPLFGPGGRWSALSRGLARKGPSSPAAFSATRIDALSNLIGQQSLSLGVLALSLVLAFWFGAGHALSPGHGKTVVAAYLVGNRGTAWHAALLGLTVTVTHTAGVFALGLVTLYLSSFILPDQLFPWLGFASGMLVAGMGIALFVKRSLALRKTRGNRAGDFGGKWNTGALRGRQTQRSVPTGAALEFIYQPLRRRGSPWPPARAQGVPTPEIHDVPGSRSEQPQRIGAASLSVPLSPNRLRSLGVDHVHTHGDEHTDGVTHRHGPFGKAHTHGMPETINIRNLIGLGISGGLLPCPSALIVLLSAIAFHRVAFGMLLIVAFSLGLATTLTSIGLLVVYSGRVLSRMRTRSGGSFVPAVQRAVRVLPIASALIVAALGTFIAIGAVSPSHLPAIFVHL